MDNFFTDPSRFTTDQGLSLTAQNIHIETIEADARWMKASPMEHYKAGRIEGAVDYQKFVPYQTKFETTKQNNIGAILQGEDVDPWSGPNESIWKGSNVVNTNFRGQHDIKGWYNRQALLSKEVYQWKSDVFGNQYFVFKDEAPEASIYDRKNQQGTLWVRNTNNEIAPATTMLSSMFLNLSAIDSSIYANLDGGVKNIEVFQDTLLIETSGYLTVNKMGYSYDDLQFSYITDSSYQISLSGGELKFVGTWFFEQTTEVSLCLIEKVSGGIVPIIYSYDVNDNLYSKVYPSETQRNSIIAETSALQISSIDTACLSFNDITKTYNVSLMCGDVNNRSLVGINLIKGVKTEVENVYAITPNQLV